MAIDPTNPKHLVAAANGFEIYTSLDGGASWTSERLTGITLSTSGNVMVPAASLSDPSVAFAPDGTLHIAGLAYIPGSAVFVISRTSPTGAWTEHTVWQSEVAATFNDKEWLGIDPTTGTMLVAWQREPAMDMLRSVEQDLGGQGVSADLDVGLVELSRSTDNGATWSVPATVSSSLHNNGTQVAFQDGKSYLLWVDYEAPGLAYVVSKDDGVSWTKPAPVADLHIAHAAGFNRMHTLPALTAGGGKIAAVWHDGRYDEADVLVSFFDGSTWSAPERVPDDAQGSGRIQFYPWGALDQDGTLHVTYYSGAVPGANDNATTFTYRAIERFGDGAWSSPLEISKPFVVLGNATTPTGYIGDYSAAAALGRDVHAAWSQPRDVGTGACTSARCSREPADDAASRRPGLGTPCRQRTLFPGATLIYPRMLGCCEAYSLTHSPR